MAGIPNNAALLAVGKQSAKGTPQTTPAYKLRYTGGFGPELTPQTVDLAESDASSLATGTLRTGFRVEGTSDHYIRPDEFGLLAYLLMGANADSGAVNFTHAATHSTAAPYATIYRSVNTTAYVDRYTDCRISSMTVTGSANGLLTCSCTWGGLSALLGQTDPVLTAVTTTPLVYTQVTTTIAGSAPGTVSTFSLTINNNSSFVEGDSGVAPVDYVQGRKLVTGSITMLFQTEADRREFFTGSTSGTTPATTIVNKTLNITASAGANNSVAFDMTNIRFNTYVPSLGTDGAPVTAAIDFAAQNLGTVAQYLTITTKNQVATY